MIIKVCGMRDTDNIRAVSALDIDLMGFIFYPKSSRYVQMIPSRAGIIPDYSRERLKNNTKEVSSVASDTKSVGVFVDDMPQNILMRVYNYNLDYVQLHGDESRTMIENLKLTLIPDIRKEIKIIKTISVSCVEDIKKCEEYEGIIDLFLFDTRCKTKGGSGNQFDWSVLDAYQGGTPFLLSGGIGPEDADRVLAYRHPMFWGIDLNSRFETDPAMKDVEKLKAFITTIRKYEQDK